MSTWSMKAKGDTLTGSRKLKTGTFAYTVKSVALVSDKFDPSGKRQQILMELDDGEGSLCRHYFAVMAEKAGQRDMAEAAIRSFAHAAGISSGVIKPETLKKLLDVRVVVTAVEVNNPNGGAAYVNISKVEAEAQEDEKPTDQEEDEDQDQEEDEDQDQEEDEDQEEDQEEEEEEAVEKVVEKQKKTQPWGKLRN